MVCKTSQHRVRAILAIFAALATSCRSPSGGLEGATKQRTLQQDAELEVEAPQERSDASVSGGASSEPAQNQTLEGVPNTLPSKEAGRLAPIHSAEGEKEGVEIPASITGAMLFCFKDKLEGSKATLLCAMQDARGKPVNLATHYSSHAWTFSNTSDLTVTVVELPATARWQAEYTVTAASPELLAAKLPSVNLAYEGSGADNITKVLNTKVVNQVRPDLTIRSLKPQGTGEIRCLDFFRMLGTRVVTTLCGVESSAQDWFVTADSKISHVSGVCLRFDPATSLAIPGDCASNLTPKFDFNINGDQIQIRDTGTCMALINPDSSGTDSVAALNCNAGDSTQHWKISPKVMP